MITQYSTRLEGELIGEEGISGESLLDFLRDVPEEELEAGYKSMVRWASKQKGNAVGKLIKDNGKNPKASRDYVCSFFAYWINEDLELREKAERNIPDFKNYREKYHGFTK